MGGSWQQRVGLCGWGRVCAVERIVSSHVHAMYFFKFCFIVIKKDELCSLHSLVVRLTLSQAMFA